ncbi:MAG: 3-phosphoshikimate 1-carboxyvinyltransferase [Planctomycetota bacterium]|nr:3-phosphoshikimate 1-carboxyvinyltransferase [Planctomycetota bacterium]
MKTLAIQPIGPFQAKVRPPGSKSLTNRALLLAALARGRSTLRGALLADDSRQMLGALQSLGYAVDLIEDALGGSSATASLDGRDGKLFALDESRELSVGNAGTSYRFLAAALCLSSGRFTLDGVARMRQRPIGQLVDPLRGLGASIDYAGEPGFPPLSIRGSAGSMSGGSVAMPPTLSSQYISALLQIAPCLARGMTMTFDAPVISRPYVEMTLALMQRFGAKFEVDDAFTRIVVKPGGYVGQDYAIEPDASNASYFLAAAAVVPGSKCTIEGLGRRSLQGDVGFADVLHTMGAGLLFGDDFITVIAPPAGQSLRGIDIDLNAMPDMAQTLAVVALFAKGPTSIRNIGNLRVKETYRLAALHTELTKLGATVEIEGDDLHIEPPANGAAGIRPAAIDTYNDHRMAMSFAVAGLRAPGVVINDPHCVDKTFPDYFERLEELRTK